MAECDEVTSDDIENAISQLKIGKHDGDQGLQSDHLIYSTLLLYRILSDFIGFSLRHSHMAECITVCTIVSIPKDGRGSMILSDNYRGICLCSSILKLFDIIMLNKGGAKLKTIDLQFTYKAGMSTTICSTVLKEVVQYYKSNGNPIYGYVFDAFKAFDRITYDKLFNGVNGVRQGGVISPIVFTVYMNKLISKLKTYGTGCWDGHHYYGCLIYADDVKLLKPLHHWTSITCRQMIRILS